MQHSVGRAPETQGALELTGIQATIALATSVGNEVRLLENRAATRVFVSYRKTDILEAARKAGKLPAFTAGEAAGATIEVISV